LNNPEYTVRFFKRTDENQVIDVVTSSLNNINKDQWLWKYIENPYFDESLAFIAENSGRVIGCLHYLPREIKIAKSLRVNTVLGADFAVYPDYREKGIGSNMLKFSRASKVFEKKGVTLTYGFINHKLMNFYKHNINTVIVPLSTALYQKFLSVDPIKKKLTFIKKLATVADEKQGKLKDANIDVLFRLTGIPIFILKVENGKVNIDTKATSNPDLEVMGDPYFFESIYNGEKGILDIMIGMLKGKIGVRGSLRKMLYFYRFIKKLERLSS